MEKEEQINKREVTIVALKEKYRKTAFVTPAIYDDNIHTYLTGQHIDPMIPSTANNLTVDEMTGKKELSNEKAKRFPYVLNPETNYALAHHRVLNISTNIDGTPVHPADFAFYNFIKYIPEVALSESAVKTDVHIVYILDKEKEASTKVTKKRQSYKAMKLIENLNFKELTDIALLLNYYVSDFNINVKSLSRTMLEEKIYDACDEHAEQILRYSEAGAKEDLFILKLYSNGIITKRENAFYDGNQFLGKMLSDIKAFVSKKENEFYMSKWAKLLKEKLGDEVDVYFNPNENKKEEKSDKPTSVLDAYNVKIMECKAFLEEKDYDNAMKKYKGACILNKEGIELKEIKEQLANLKAELNK
jgi:hypothetical protein